MEGVSFIFCDPKAELIDAWNSEIKKHLTLRQQERFATFHGYLKDVPWKFDCIVSPGNTSGRLDGSFDKVISEMFHRNEETEESVTSHVQKTLHETWNGYQPTGTCQMIDMSGFTESNPNKFGCNKLAHCPTMHIPGSCVWDREVVFKCFWSLLCQIQLYNNRNPKSKVDTVLCTGLGTGVGILPSNVCAAQMVLAYSHFEANLEKVPKTTSWRQATDLGLALDETLRVPSMFSSGLRPGK